MKQAKEEAEHEVAAYKAEREAEFKRKIADDINSSQEHIASLNAESDRAVAAIKDSVGSKKDKVIDMLMTQVLNVGGS